MPFKTFVAGETFTASDLNTYLAKQAVVVCTSGTRPASPVEGMVVYETDTDRLATYNGTTWVPAAAALHVQPGSWTAGTAYSALTPSLVLPAGNWVVQAKGHFAVSTTTNRQYDVQLWNSTTSAELDAAGAKAGIDANMPWALMSPLSITASTTVQVRAKTSAVDGTQLVTNVRLWAVGVTVIG